MFEDFWLEEFKKDLDNPKGFNNSWIELTTYLATIVQILIDKNIAKEEEITKWHDTYKKIAKDESIKIMK